MNKILATIAIAGFLATTGVALAEGTATTIATTNANKIACVGAAVAIRESALVSAMTAYTSGMNTAHATRATALASAYSQTTAAGVRTAVKAAWSAFNTSVKNARRAWQKAKNDAWKAYRTSAVACKPFEGLGDGSNSGSEMNGN